MDYMVVLNALAPNTLAAVVADLKEWERDLDSAEMTEAIAVTTAELVAIVGEGQAKRMIAHEVDLRV